MGMQTNLTHVLSVTVGWGLLPSLPNKAYSSLAFVIKKKGHKKVRKEIEEKREEKEKKIFGPMQMCNDHCSFY